MMRLDFITRDLSLKLFSLGVAIIFFFFVSVESATPVGVDYSIEYKIPPDMMLTGDAPSTLHATLQGPWAAFRSYDSSDVDPVVVDLGDAPAGTLRKVIDTGDVRPPAGMKVVALRPSELELTLDRRVERMTPVQADIPTRPAFGYEILDVRIDPPRVPVVGPSQKMATLQYVNTRVIDVNGRETSLSVDVDLRAPPPPLTLEVTRVHVMVEIGEEFVQRVFRDVPVRLVTSVRGVVLATPTVTVTVRGPRRTVDKMEKKSLLLQVEAEPEYSEGLASFEKPVVLQGELPDRVQLLAPVPKVTVEIPRRRKKR